MNRRQCLRQLAAGTAAASLGLPAWLSAAGGRPPNVVLILSDDLGSVDLGCYGAADLATPHLDALASRGVRFSQFYVGAPLCSASRAGLLTGRYFQRALDQSKGLRASETTMAEMFRAAGYRTALYGKWHLAGDPPNPNGHGFDDFLGHTAGAVDSYSHFSYWDGAPGHALVRNGAPYYEDGSYLPELLVRESCRFIEQDPASPFFLLLSLNQPHYPMQPEARFREASGHIADPNRRLYAANVSSMDAKVGQVVACLERNGLRDDTIIIFLSDHGHSDEPGGRGGSAGVLRGGKMTLFEGGIRVPCIAAWPGRFPAAVCAQPVMAMDWLPTLAAYCGLDVTGLQLDGRSLQTVIDTGAPSPHPQLHWMMGSYWAVRDDRWKLITHNVNVFLADLKSDPGERQNVATDHWEVVDRLQLSHEEWLAREALTPYFEITND